MAGQTTVISVRVPTRLKEELEKRGVNVAEAVRRALQEELERLEWEELAQELEKIREELGDKVTTEQVVRIIREARDER